LRSVTERVRIHQFEPARVDEDGRVQLLEALVKRLSSPKVVQIVRRDAVVGETHRLEHYPLEMVLRDEFVPHAPPHASGFLGGAADQVDDRKESRSFDRAMGNIEFPESAVAIVSDELHAERCHQSLPITEPRWIGASFSLIWDGHPDAVTRIRHEQSDKSTRSLCNPTSRRLHPELLPYLQDSRARQPS